MKRRSLLAALAATPLVPRAAGAQQGQWQPDRPIRIVVPFAPGGATDTMARLVAEAISGPLGQSVVVENRTGAGATIGAEYVARSAPDGYTLLMGTNTPMAAAPAIHPNLSYDPLRDFAAVSIVALSPNMAAVHPSVPANTLQEFIAYARANPGKVSYGSAGVGSSQHIAGALLAHMAGLEMTHVAYRGGAPAALDLIAGRVQLVINPLIEVLPYIREGKIRPLGATTRQLHVLFPDLPSIGGVLPGFEVASWQGPFAPARTPRAAA
ncbi:Bug family tripartite tricarboxylate transporter substrate binding protein [Caldovatus aquaticus]|uniref:Tripartite tricarboxylate transporter substrate binding protein n=1 Tax=Caldovatus aquaticus TaxID=2865671 RepID=A0ABS7F1I9_9PROT|nr:tripartite tricarboxylate transporter substrate-binding protein [Caldovatus aquaticus]MBW8268671.1 tripartite tricarboxylate transporter substrate binding protein [Caldovatus aquaticus]